jgi:hypothetical protein
MLNGALQQLFIIVVQLICYLIIVHFQYLCGVPWCHWCGVPQSVYYYQMFDRLIRFYWLQVPRYHISGYKFPAITVPSQSHH